MISYHVADSCDKHADLYQRHVLEEAVNNG
jgi:hypothetical protein